MVAVTTIRRMGAMWGIMSGGCCRFWLDWWALEQAVVGWVG